MSTGDAIITSTLLVITAALAWRISIAHRWGTVGKVLGAIVLLIALIIGAFSAYQRYQERPRVVYALNDIRIGMTEAEVLVKMGNPSRTSNYKNSKILTYTKEYNSEYSFDVLVSNKTSKIEVVCESGEFTDIYMASYLSEDELTNRFGKPENVFVEPSGNYKSIFYPNYNITFIIRFGRISKLCMSPNAQEYLY